MPRHRKWKRASGSSRRRSAVDVDDLFVQGFHRALRPGGALVFTAEASDDEERGWSLNDGGRYAHHPAYLRRVLEAAGFEVREMVEDRIRFELGTPAMGWVVTAFVPEVSTWLRGAEKSTSITLAGLSHERYRASFSLMPEMHEGEGRQRALARL